MTELNKIPPQAIELEEAVLGAILTDSNAYDEVSDIINDFCFYKDSHQRIFRAMRDIKISHNPIDLHTLIQSLKARNELDVCGGAMYVSGLANKVMSASNIRSHARIVLESYIKRELITLTAYANGRGYDQETDCLTLFDELDTRMDAIKEMITTGKVVSFQTQVEQTQKEIFERSKSGTGLSGIPSGFRDIDKITGGFTNSDLIILGGRPAMGKTSFALQIIKSVASLGFKTGVISLEMSSSQLITKLISNDSGINTTNLRRGILSDDDLYKLDSSCMSLKQLPILLDDTAGLKLTDLHNKVKQWKRKNGLDILFIDYLQLTNAGEKGKNKEQQVSDISQTFKIIAKELNIPVVALAQLSRALESRGDKRPMLSDLRDSGAIEQDADIVCFIYRDEYYNENTDFPNVTEIGFEKNRHGSLDTVFLGHDLSTNRYSDYNDYKNSASQLGINVTNPF